MSGKCGSVCLSYMLVLHTVKEYIFHSLFASVSSCVEMPLLKTLQKFCIFYFLSAGGVGDIQKIKT